MVKKGHFDEKAAELRKQYEDGVIALTNRRNTTTTLAIQQKNIAVKDAKTEYAKEIAKLRNKLYGKRDDPRENEKAISQS